MTERTPLPAAALAYVAQRAEYVDNPPAYNYSSAAAASSVPVLQPQPQPEAPRWIRTPHHHTPTPYFPSVEPSYGYFRQQPEAIPNLYQGYYQASAYQFPQHHHRCSDECYEFELDQARSNMRLTGWATFFFCCCGICLL